jgi:hypothetical protein
MFLKEIFVDILKKTPFKATNYVSVSAADWPEKNNPLPQATYYN